MIQTTFLRATTGPGNRFSPRSRYLAAIAAPLRPSLLLLATSLAAWSLSTLPAHAAPAAPAVVSTTQDSAPEPTAEPVALKRLPRGTSVRVRLSTPLSSRTSNAGEQWRGVLNNDIVLDGRVAVAAGSPVNGIVFDAQQSGRLSHRSELDLQLTSVNRIPVNSDLVSRGGRRHFLDNVTKIGGGVIAGAVAGGLVGGAPGAVIGGAAGAGAGTAAAVATGKHDIVLPTETLLTFVVQ